MNKMMDKITGNFLNQPNRDFPLDCETLAYMQELSVLAGVLGNMGGDKIVLSGCMSNGDGTRRGAGYVFVRTVDCPEGEVLRWEGGPTTSGMYLKQEAIGVRVNNVDYPKAYTRRTLAPGIGAETYDWGEFADIRSIRELMDDNRRLREDLTRVERSPLGMVEMWAGREVPGGYVLCDGRSLSQRDYPDLYAALGTTFNNAMSAAGVRYTTAGGQFRVPDLRGRFVVGQHDSDADYRAAGSAGGEKMVALTAEEMPEHGHNLRDYYHATYESAACGNHDKWGVNGGIGTQFNNNHSFDLHWVYHHTEQVGGGAAHENRPPYYVLAYIMRVR